MKRIIIVVLLLYATNGYAQEFENNRIKQLKKSLSTHKGILRVEALLKICKEYFEAGFFGEKDTRTDSIVHYATLANKESEKSRFQNGIVHSSLYLGFSKMIKGDFQGAEAHLQYVLNQKNSTHEILGHANGFLTAIYFERYHNGNKALHFANKSLEHFQKSGDKKHEGLASRRIAMLYMQKSDLVNAAEYFSKALQVGRQLVNKSPVDGWTDLLYLEPLNQLTELYTIGGDYKAAKEFLNETQAYFQKNKRSSNLNYQWAKVFFLEGKYDSAAHFLKIERAKKREIILSTWELGKTYLESKDYQTALKYLHEASDTFRSRITQPNRPRPKLNLLQTLISTAKAYYNLKDFQKANIAAAEGLKLLQENRTRFSPIQQAELFADAYRFTGNTDSALVYYQRYKSLQDSLVSKQFIFKLNNLKRAVEDEKNSFQMALLQKGNELKAEQIRQEQLLKKEKENQLALLDKDYRLKDQQLKQEAILRQQKEANIALLHKSSEIKQQQLQQQAFLKNIFAAGLAIFVLLSMFVFRILALKRKNEKLQREKVESEYRYQQLEYAKKQSELQQQATELEMQALRAQMNPHFIFNCLSSINWLILGNNTDAASDYLTRFARLIRMVLINSEKTVISLEEELHMLQLYLDMERLRFENAFDYQIKFHDDLPTASIPVPPLLLQPFCENAIWHGLMHKDGKGTLTIEINASENNLYCTITDDGVGRKKAGEMQGDAPNKNKSMGLKITAARLSLFNQNKSAQTFYDMEDLIDAQGNPAGTRVMIKIKQKQKTEELITS